MTDFTTASFYQDGDIELQGPPGPEGPEGPQGPIGPIGPNGKDALVALFEAMTIAAPTASALVDYLKTLIADTPLPVINITGPGPHTLLTSQQGRRIRISNGGDATPITVYLPRNAPVGTLFLPRQAGVAPLIFMPEFGAPPTVNFDGHNRTAGLHASVLVSCETNADGNNAVYTIEGSTAATP